METGSCTPLPPTGGYECDFVDPIPESLSCAVCLLPFRDPSPRQLLQYKSCDALYLSSKGSSSALLHMLQEFTLKLYIDRSLSAT